MLSGDDCEKEAWRVGVDAFLRKPEGIDKISATITRVLEERKERTDYIDRRIIGLPYEHIVYDGPTGALRSREVLYYVWGGDYLSGQTPATNYDSGNYPSWFVVGRGDLMAVRRYNCENGSTAYDDNQALWVQINGYDMAGSLVWNQDGGGHRVHISYADSFSDGNNSRGTLAYPTTLTDADGYQSFTQYNYDFGAQTRVQGPPPNNQPNGIVQTFTYDDARRVKRATVANTGAYTHYEYGPNYTQSYSSVNTVSENPYASDSYAIQVFDGAGRVFATQGLHPGSTGSYKAQLTYYDAMGRVMKQSNPTEVTSSWAPTGDDAGWLFTQQTYDWKGRPRITTNTDGTQRSATYSACGCAGSEAVTVMDEAGRQHRTTNDVLGRLAKVEELNWDSTVYSTANYAYDALDHVTNITHEGQVRSFAYDGHGRLQTRTTPEQGTTTYAYNADDTTYSVTDARGASSTLSYNSRHLVTGRNYSAPYGVAPTPNVSFGYDAAGNKTLMTDGLGSVSYGYNQLSQLTSETRTLSVGSFALSYDYNLAGELTSVTNPWGAQVGYGYDSTGRLTNVSGSGYAGVSSYASGLNYRAWDAVKSMSYGNNLTLSTAYDGRLRPTTRNVSNVLGYNYSYDYYNERTGRVTYAQSIYDSTLDRSYQYDQVEGLVISHSGAEARASAYSGQWGIMDGPYSQGYDYDKFGNMTRRYGWGGEVQGGTAGQSSDIFYSYTNNRRDGFSYDPAGNLTNDLVQSYSYDATGQQTTASASSYFLQQGYDGDGLRAQKTENGAVTYYVRSSVLGAQVVAEIDGNGGWQRGYVYAGSSLLAVQQGGVNWVHEDSVTKSKRITDVYGNIVSNVELDPWGADTNRSSNTAFQPQSFTSYIRDANGGQDAMARRYSAGGRFSQPDPYGGSYDFSDPQSLNRYAYTKNDPVNFRDPSGLELCFESWCSGGSDSYGAHVGWGTTGRYFGSYGNPPPGFSSHIREAMTAFDQRVQETIYASRLREPQNPNKAGPHILNDPDTLSANGNNCSLTVTFTSGTSYSGHTELKNGVSTIPYNGISSFGLGFTVSGSAKGGIGRVGGTSNPQSPGGTWTMDQSTSRYLALNGQTLTDDHEKSRRDISTGINYSTSGNSFSWYDHPGGPPNDGLLRMQNFTVSVSNGNESCAVSFHFLQTGNSIHWGQGSFP